MKYTFLICIVSCFTVEFAQGMEASEAAEGAQQLRNAWKNYYNLFQKKQILEKDNKEVSDDLVRELAKAQQIHSDLANRDQLKLAQPASALVGPANQPLALTAPQEAQSDQQASNPLLLILQPGIVKKSIEAVGQQVPFVEKLNLPYSETIEENEQVTLKEAIKNTDPKLTEAEEALKKAEANKKEMADLFLYKIWLKMGGKKSNIELYHVLDVYGDHYLIYDQKGKENPYLQPLTQGKWLDEAKKEIAVAKDDLLVRKEFCDKFFYQAQLNSIKRKLMEAFLAAKENNNDEELPKPVSTRIFSPRVLTTLALATAGTLGIWYWARKK